MSPVVIISFKNLLLFCLTYKNTSERVWMDCWQQHNQSLFWFERSIKTKLDTDEEVDINMMEERFERVCQISSGNRQNSHINYRARRIRCTF